MKRPLIWMLLGMTIAGCRKTADESPVYAIIDGHPITVSFVRDTVLVSARIAEVAEHPIKPQRFPAWGNRMARKIVPGLVGAYLWEREICRQGMEPTETDCQVILKKYNQMMATNVASIVEMAPIFGERAEFFKTQFRRECRFEAYSRQFLRTETSEQELQDFYRAKTNAIRYAAVIDREAREKIQEAWQELKSGVDWMTVATNYSEDAELDDSYVDFHKEWGVFGLKDFAKDPLGAVLPKLKVGEYSEPFETDEGMVIVKVNEICEDVYTCARILVRMTCPIEVPEPEKARKMLAKQKFRKAQADLIASLKEKSKIDYPNGTNFTFKIWQPTEKPARRKAK